MSPRKKSDTSKNLRFEIRLNEDTANVLDECAKALSITKSAVIHKGIELVKSEIEQKK